MRLCCDGNRRGAREGRQKDQMRTRVCVSMSISLEVSSLEFGLSISLVNG